MHSLRKIGGDGLKLILIALILQLGFSIFSPVIQYYIEALENPEIPPPEIRERVTFTDEVIYYVALNIAVFMIMRAPFATIFGRLSDKFGRKRIIVIGLLFYVIFGIGLALAQTPIDIVYLRAFQGVTSAMVWPVALAMLMDIVSADIRARATALYVIGLNIANMAGPALGGIIYGLFYSFTQSSKAIDIIRPTIASPIPLFILGFLLGITLKEHIVSSKPEKPQHVFMSSEARKSINVIYVTGMMNGFGVGIAVSILIVYISEFIVKEPGIIGLILLLTNAIGTIFAYPIAKYADVKLGKKKIISIFMILRGFGFMLIPLFLDLVAFIVVASLVYIAFNTVMPSLRALQADLTPTEIRGRVFGQQQMFFNFGMAVGALVGAYLYIHYRFETFLSLPGTIISFLPASMFSLISAFLIYMFVEERSVR